jgi:hypothetical protein
MALATHISGRMTWLAGVLGLIAGMNNQVLADLPATDTRFVAHARKAYQEAQARYQKDPRDRTVAWEFGRACFDLAEFATNNTQRASLADQGIAACRFAIERGSNSAPAHYYLGMNLGQQARTKTLGALKLVVQIEREFSRARDLDEHIDFAGPDRNLGLLYKDAPAIGSVGSRTRAREHLRRAVELEPQYPDNRLNLIEAYLDWGERAGAYRELQALEAAWPAARTNFVGEAWAAYWADWEPRRSKLKKKIEGAPKALGPRAK